MPPQRRAMGPTWADVDLAPIVLVRGAEGLLADRTQDRLRFLALEADPQTEVTVIDAANYGAGQLSVMASPSLFGERRLLLVPELELMSDALLQDLLAYLAAPAEDVWLVLRHNSGTRGKKLLDAITKAGYPVVRCEQIKKARDKAELLRQDAARARRRIDQGAIEALVDALGDDLREMSAAFAQLVADTSGTITAEDVNRYHGGRVQATGFSVADAALGGNIALALIQLRHAVGTGVSPAAIVGALAVKIRGLAKVSGAGRGMGPGDLGMAPWQLERARRELRNWSEDGLATALLAVARADAEVKGLSRAPVHALEHALITVAQARGR